MKNKKKNGLEEENAKNLQLFEETNKKLLKKT